MSKRMTVIFEDEALYTALKVAAAGSGPRAEPRVGVDRVDDVDASHCQRPCSIQTPKQHTIASHLSTAVSLTIVLSQFCSSESSMFRAS